ncbi:hypothetical protein LG634_07635 [Streptomyces bambusae]|uniref:hypothetical protein n=1 Tax=Streptomyces bambusae TaxID=1550616 RepID=UPI001CFE1A75|nr:hypothetical protein [Streptomyces bambusae]MCB5164705.1 hypothetical protein [Streptomyces bambusae]
MRRSRLSILALVLTAGAVTAAATAPVAAAAPRGGGDRKVTLNWTQTIDRHDPIDVAPAGESVGDQSIAGGTVYRNGSAVGTFDLICTITRVDAQSTTTQCQSAYTLPEGGLTFWGRHTQPLGTPIHLGEQAGSRISGVTSGTADYKTARGQGTFTRTGGASQSVSVALTLDKGK